MQVGTPCTLQPKARNGRQLDSISFKGSAAHRVCSGVTLGSKSPCWQVCIGLPVSPIQYLWRSPWTTLYSPVQLIPHDRASRLPYTLKKSWHICPWVSLQYSAYNHLRKHQAFIPLALFQAQQGTHAWVPLVPQLPQVGRQCSCFSMRPGPATISCSHRPAV